MTIVLPGTRGLFSAVQHGMTTRPSSNQVTLDEQTHQAIDDFQWMMKNTLACPTIISELVPLDPSVTGAHNTEWMGT